MTLSALIRIRIIRQVSGLKLDVGKLK